jgi:hypothetical protein
VKKLMPTGKTICSVTGLAGSPSHCRKATAESAKKLKYLKKPRVPRL